MRDTMTKEYNIIQKCLTPLYCLYNWGWESILVAIGITFGWVSSINLVPLIQQAGGWNLILEILQLSNVNQTLLTFHYAVFYRDPYNPLITWVVPSLLYTAINQGPLVTAELNTTSQYPSLTPPLPQHYIASVQHQAFCRLKIWDAWVEHQQNLGTPILWLIYLRAPQHTPGGGIPQASPFTPKWKEFQTINCWLGVVLVCSFRGMLEKS